MGQQESATIDESVPPQTLSARSLDAVAELMQSDDCQRIVVLTGAGISTAAGIPDFRSPETGLYSNLARLNLPYAEAVFDIDFFRRRPEPFYVLARELYPGRFRPTVSHAFIALLARRHRLHTLFTQNIDCLEREAGVPADRIVEAHGSFATQRCIDCRAPFEDAAMREHVLAGRVPCCPEPSCAGSEKGLVKPDIVFFGEPLPAEFSSRARAVASADLVLVIGTSLSVYPFAGLPEMARPGTPRVLFNMERVGRLGARADDVIELGPCDAGIRALADALGWRDELEQLWRDVVGEKEAERQLASRSPLSMTKTIADEDRESAEGGTVEDDDQYKDEMQRLVDGVGAALTLDDDAETGERSVEDIKEQQSASTPRLPSPASKAATHPGPSDSINTPPSKSLGPQERELDPVSKPPQG